MSEINAFIHLMNSDDNTEISENDLESIFGGGVDCVWVFHQTLIGMKKIAKKCWDLGRWFANTFG